jgi:hypothetical protein
VTHERDYSVAEIVLHIEPGGWGHPADQGASVVRSAHDPVGSSAISSGIDRRLRLARTVELDAFGLTSPADPVTISPLDPEMQEPMLLRRRLSGQVSKSA